jgi:hypothetical protein
MLPRFHRRRLPSVGHAFILVSLLLLAQYHVLRASAASAPPGSGHLPAAVSARAPVGLSMPPASRGTPTAAREGLANPDSLPPGLYPALLSTAQRTGAPGYRPRAVPAGAPRPLAASAHAGVLATNSAQHLQAGFAADGVTVHATHDPAHDGLRFRLLSAAYGMAMQPVTPASPVVSGTQVHYRHGPLDEWYINGPAGLEQGFTLATAPAGARSGAPLVLTLALDGVATPHLHGEALLSGDGALRYDHLYAYDAANRRLPAHLELQAGAAGGASLLRLVVDDRQARYPVTIDPLLQSTLIPPLGTSYNAVALSGDGLTALVGAYGTSKVYVFSRSKQSAFNPAIYTTLTNGLVGTDFGWSVALSGDGLTALVGTFGYGAYVYTRAPGGAFNSAVHTTLVRPASSSFWFGCAVALSSNGLTALVGTCAGNHAYVYSRTVGGAFNPSAYTTLTGPAGSGFGSAVALSSDGLTALVGAYAGNHAYIYSRAVGGAFNPSAYTTLVGPINSYHFGYAVALSGNGLTALVGTNGSRYAYVYSRTVGSAFNPSAYTTLMGPPGSNFGAAVALSANGLTALVGADANGTAYLYTRPSGSTFLAGTYSTITEPVSRPGDRFGYVVALSGDGLTGMVCTDDYGTVYTYNIPPTTIFTSQTPSTGYLGTFELGVKFQSTVAGHIAGLRYYRVAGESGIHIGHLWSATGTLLGTVIFTKETASGWQTAYFATPIAILANTTYVASVNSNVMFGTTDNGLASSVSNGTLRTVADGHNGVYSTRGTFPVASYLSRNYFCDVVFVTP